EPSRTEHQDRADRDDAHSEIGDSRETEEPDHGTERNDAEDPQEPAEQHRGRGKCAADGPQDEGDEQHREAERADDEDPREPRHRDRTPRDEGGREEHERHRRGERDTKQLVRDIRRYEGGHDHGRAPEGEEQREEQERDGETRSDARQPDARTLVEIVPRAEVRHAEEIEEDESEYQRSDERGDRVGQGDLPEPIREERHRGADRLLVARDRQSSVRVQEEAQPTEEEKSTDDAPPRPTA